MKKGRITYAIKKINQMIVLNFDFYVGDTLDFVVQIEENIDDLIFKVVSDNVVYVKKELGNGIVDLGDNKYEIIASDIDPKTSANLFYELNAIKDNQIYTLMSGKINIIYSAIKEFTISNNDFLNIDLSPFANKTLVTCDFEGIDIRAYAFYNFSSLAYIMLPSSLKSIGMRAFSGCTNLMLSSLPNGIRTIDGGAFNLCRNLALSSLPDALEYIGGGTFYGCGIQTMVFPKNLKFIGNGAFTNCLSLTNVVFTAKVKNVMPDVFQGCTNLIDIYVPWAEGEVDDAPWGATNATIHYNS